MNQFNTQNSLPETGYLRLPEVLRIIPVGASTWWAGVADERFPKPVKLGPRTSAWRVEDIRALMERINQGAEND